MGLGDVTKLACKDAVFHIDIDTIHKKVLYNERTLPSHEEGIKNAYKVYKTLSKDTCTLDGELKEIGVRLTKLLSFLYGKTLTNIELDNDGNVTLESIDEMILEMKEFEKLFNNPDMTLDFSAIDGFANKDYERSMEVMTIGDDDDTNNLPDKNYIYVYGEEYRGDILTVIVTPQNVVDDFSRNKYMCIIPIVTGNYETDKITTLLEIVGAFSASKCKQGSGLNVISEHNVHVEVVHMINHIAQSLMYMKNCHSFRQNELYSFDEMEYNTSLDTIEYFIYVINRDLSIIRDIKHSQNTRHT